MSFPLSRSLEAGSLEYLELNRLKELVERYFEIPRGRTIMVSHSLLVAAIHTTLSPYCLPVSSNNAYRNDANLDRFTIDNHHTRVEGVTVTGRMIHKNLVSNRPTIPAFTPLPTV